MPAPTSCPIEEPGRIEPAEQPSRSARFVCVPINSLKAGKRRLRRPGKRQFDILKAVIGRFGCVVAVLVSADFEIRDGHLVWEVCKALGHETITVVVVDYLSEPGLAALRIALHKLSELSSFDEAALSWIWS